MSARRLCAWLGAAALVLLAAMAILLAGRAQDTPELAQPVMITDMSVGELTAAAASVGETRMAIMISGGMITLLDAPQGAQLAEGLLKAYLYRMAHMPAERTLGTIGDPAEYGFDACTAAVALLGADGSRTRLFLGDEAPFDGLWYLMREGDDTLYLIDGMTAQMMRYTPDDFRALDLFPDVTDLTSVRRLTLCTREQTLDIRGETKDGAVYFAMTQPYEALLSWETVVSALVSPLSALEKTDYVSADVPKDAYGLSGADAIQLTVEAGGRTRTLRFAPADDTHLYCAADGAPDVVRVSREAAAFLQVQAADLLDATLYTRSAADVERIEVSAAGIHGVLSITGSGALLSGRIAERTLTQEETVSLYKRLTMLPPAQALEEGAAVAGEPVLRLGIVLRDGTTDELALIPVSERRCAVMINGEVHMTTYTSTVEEIIRVSAQAFGG